MLTLIVLEMLELSYCFTFLNQKSNIKLTFALSFRRRPKIVKYYEVISEKRQKPVNHSKITFHNSRKR